MFEFWKDSLDKWLRFERECWREVIKVGKRKGEKAWKVKRVEIRRRGLVRGLEQVRFIWKEDDFRFQTRRLGTYLWEVRRRDKSKAAEIRKIKREARVRDGEVI